MAESPLSLPAFMLALLLPWLVGIIGARPLVTGAGPGRRYVIAGFGYFLGTFLATLILRLADVLGAPPDFRGLATGLGLVGLLLLLLGRIRAPRYQAAAPREETLPLSARAMVGILVALLVWRYLTLAGIILEQPLWGWDAMMNWAPKAIVWFHNGELTDFVGPTAWLQGSAAAGPYTLGNPAASTYPEMVPLIFLWHMLGAGTWDHPLLQLPWLFAALNLGLALYGLMRMAGLGVLVSAAGCYFLLSLPYLNVHTAVAGYADLWLAAVFSLGAISLNDWEQRGSPGMALVALLAATMCMQLKNPGIILGLLLLVGMLRIRLALRFRTELLALTTVVGLIALAFLLDLRINVPLLGLVNFGAEQFQVGPLGPQPLRFHPETGAAVLSALFEQANWHLLWYLAALALASMVLVERDWRRPATLALIVSALAVFYVAVFFFTNYYYHAISFITLNRAVLWVVPILVFWLFARLARENNGSA